MNALLTPLAATVAVAVELLEAMAFVLALRLAGQRRRSSLRARVCGTLDELGDAPRPLAALF